MLQGQEQQIARMKEVEFEALKEVQRVCEKNKIQFFLSDGTLLGAVRHKGFIPWDDDIDIIMTQKNYKKFCRACKKDLSPKYFLQNYKTDRCYIPFAKIRVNGTTAMGTDEKNMQLHTGMWIDIFPLVGLSGSGKQLKRKNALEAWRINLLKDDYFLAHGQQLDKKMQLLYKLPLFLRRWLASLIELYTCRDCANTAFCGVYFPIIKRLFRTNLFSGTVDVEFEGETFPGPVGWDEYLRTQYGDYMQLPPKDERCTVHHFLHIDADRDYTEYRKDHA